jgi:UDP-N-acetylmuramoylalanine--D-glutamate ligase
MSSDLFAELSGLPVVGITGTRGKSTVTHAVAHILRTAGKEVVLGGNIKGVSTLEQLAHVTPNAIAVLELDSWQLQGFGDAKISPQVAVFTTFMPDHMNYYKNDMKMYFADKANIFLNQKEDDFLILGAQMAQYVEEFGYKKQIKAHTTVVGEKELPKDWHLKIPGGHNRYNASIAVAVAGVLGIDDNVIKSAIESFEGVEGRLEFLREVNGVKIYNDTTATVPDATVVALKALDPEAKKDIILIMGGADKGLDMSELLQEIPNYCKKVLLLAGTGTERIKNELSNAEVFDSLESAVNAAVESAAAGDILLLSPAFASFGMFKNEYDRGDQFKKLVAALS